MTEIIKSNMGHEPGSITSGDITRVEKSTNELASSILDALLADDIFTKHFKSLDPAEVALYATLYIDASLQKAFEDVGITEVDREEVLINNEE